MISEIQTPKEKFLKALNKGRILSTQEILDEDALDDQIKHLITNWYRNITELKFLPEFPDNLEEIIVHSPTNIIYKSNGTSSIIDCDLTREDFNIFLDHLAIKNGISWNLKTPFVSFFSLIRGREVRISMIHGASNHDGIAKVFIRFLNNYSIPLSSYGKHALNLSKHVLAKSNILVCGATGSGKTTFMNSLMQNIPSSDHTVILEDTKELISPHTNTTSFLSKSELGEEYTLLAYLKFAMRMTPDRIIIGELRSKEVEPLLSALNSGHNGIISSIHSNNAQGALEKFSLLCQLYGKSNLQYELVLKLICQNIDYVVYLENKKIKQIIQVFGSDQGQIFFEDLIPL